MLHGVPGNAHAQLTVKKEGYVKRAHAIEMCKDITDENVGQAITVHVETKQVKVERRVAQEFHVEESGLEMVGLELYKVLLCEGKNLRCLCPEGVSETIGP